MVNSMMKTKPKARWAVPSSALFTSASKNLPEQMAPKPFTVSKKKALFILSKCLSDEDRHLQILGYQTNCLKDTSQFHCRESEEDTEEKSSKIPNSQTSTAIGWGGSNRHCSPS